MDQRVDDDSMTGLSFRLTPEQREMVGTVRALAQDKFKPRVKTWQDGTFPHENIKELAEIGVIGMSPMRA